MAMPISWSRVSEVIILKIGIWASEAPSVGTAVATACAIWMARMTSWMSGLA
jgi:hypothetical protein